MANKIKDLIAHNLRKPSSGFFGWFVTKSVFLKRNVYLEENAAKLCKIEPHYKVLEVGFGPGVGLSAASKYVINGPGQIHGVDYSDKMVDLAHKRLTHEITAGKVCIQKGNVLDLPFENDTFDRVFHCNCYYFWPDLKVGCKELYRVMKPQSYMVTTINIDFMKNTVNKGFMTYGKPDHVPYMKTLEEVGFRDVNIQTMKDNGKKYEAIFAHVTEK